MRTEINMDHFRCLTAFRFSFDLFGQYWFVCACIQHPKSIITNQKLERPIPRLVKSETTGLKPR
jgi:hypothetical protein